MVSDVEGFGCLPAERVLEAGGLAIAACGTPWRLDEGVSALKEGYAPPLLETLGAPI